MLEIKDIHTYYGNIHALKGVSLRVSQGLVRDFSKTIVKKSCVWLKVLSMWEQLLKIHGRGARAGLDLNKITL